MTFKEKRKAIEEFVIKSANIIDKTHINGNHFEEFFKSMDDKKFESWIKKFIKDPEENFYFEILPYKNEPVLKDLEDAGKFMNCPLEEYIYFRHNGNEDNPVRSAHKVPVGYITIKRLRVKRFLRNLFLKNIGIKRIYLYINKFNYLFE